MANSLSSFSLFVKKEKTILQHSQHPLSFFRHDKTAASIILVLSSICLTCNTYSTILIRIVPS